MVARAERSMRGYPIVLPTRRDPRLRLAAVTTSLHILGQTTFNFNLSITQIFISLAAAATVEFLVVLVRDHKIAWPASALLTGNSVALILRVPGTEHGEWWSTRGWYIFAATSALAVASKYLIRWKGAHFFNPSNLMLVVAFLVLGEARADPQILWWGPWSVGLALGFGVILAGSVAVTHHVRQLHTALAFWMPFAVLMGVVSLSGHAITTNWYVGPLTGWPYFVTLVLSPEVLVFTFFMITDPKASPVTDRGKVIFGFVIAILSALFVSTQTGEFGTKVGILAGLVVLCPAIPFINARTGAPAMPVPTGTPFIATPTGSLPTETSCGAGGESKVKDPIPVVAAVRGITPRQSALATVALLIAVGLVFTLGSSRSTATIASGTASSMERRGEVSLEGIEMPTVQLDDSAARSAFQLTPDVADRIARDVVTDLLLEARSVADRDLELASAGIAGERLKTVQEAIDELKGQSEAMPSTEVSYYFESIVVATFKPDDGPQTPPELAVHLVGTVNGDGGSIDMDDWFTVARVDEIYLVTSAFDEDRVLITPGPLDERINTRIDARPGSDQDVPPRVTATGQELNGLRMVERSSEMGLTLPQSRFALETLDDFKIGGLAVGDVDGDGYPDVYFPRVGYPDVFYRNEGGQRFVDATVDAGLATVSSAVAIDGGSTTATFADINGDGHLDLITLGVSGSANRLYLGSGDGKFTDATEEWGLPAGPTAMETDVVPTSIAVADMDHDGWPDVLLLAAEPNRIHRALTDAGIDEPAVCGQAARDVVADLPSESSHTVMLRNTGSRFENVTDRLGVDPSHLAASAARFVDLDDDGWDDLVITGDSCTTRVLHNDHGSFTDITDDLGLGDITYATGITTLELATGDGMRTGLFMAGAASLAQPDQCVTSVPGYSCGANRFFALPLTGVSDDDGERAAPGLVAPQHLADQAGVQQLDAVGWEWGATAADLNNDGHRDLYVATGVRTVADWFDRLSGQQSDSSEWIRSPDSLWIGASDPPMRVTDLHPFEGRSSDLLHGRAVVAADFNRDGRMDLLVANNGSFPSLLINETDNANAWVGIELSDDTTHNTAGLGAKVMIETDDGEIQQSRVGVDGSYSSGENAGVHFGLGEAPKVRSVRIRWTDGTVQIVDSPIANQWTVIRRRP